MHLKFNISDTHIWWKGSSRLNSNSTFQNYFPLGSPYFITCFPSWIPVFYHMISLLNPRIFTTWFHSWDSCILTTRFSSWILVFLPHDFPLGSFYFFHMISFLNLCIFTTYYVPPWFLVFLSHDFPLGSLYFYHMISFMDPRIITTWFPSWILVFCFTRL